MASKEDGKFANLSVISREGKEWMLAKFVCLLDWLFCFVKFRLCLFLKKLA